MINLDNILNNNNKEHNEKWPFFPDHPYRILIIVGSGSGKTNTLLNLINEQEAKRLNLFIHCIWTFIECSNTMNDIYENIINYNPKRKGKILIAFDDMIVYYGTITIDEAESKQVEFNTVLNLFKKYSPKHDQYVTFKK